MLRFFVALRCAVLAALTVLIVSPANAYSEDYTNLNLVGKSDLIVVGIIGTTKDDFATFKISKTIFGKAPSELIKISPVIAVSDHGPYVSLKPGDVFIAMLVSTKTEGEYKIAEQFHGKIALTPENRSDSIFAIERLAKISKMDEDKRNREMLSLVNTNNKILQREAVWYIEGELGHSKFAKNHTKTLISLLKNKDLRTQEAALTALGNFKADAAIPEIIKASRDVDLYRAASRALAQYDTDETSAALIALSYNNIVEICTASMMALRDSHRPDVKARLIQLLDNPNLKIRGFALFAMMKYLQRGEANEALPKMLSMLDNRAEDIQDGAARVIGESRNPMVIGPLLDILKRPNLREKLELRTIESLNVACANKECAKIVADELPLVIQIMERGHERADTRAAEILANIGTPEAIAALKKAAESAPREENRQHSQRLLKAMEKPAE